MTAREAGGAPDDAEQLLLPGARRPRRRPRPASAPEGEPAAELPVARVAVDVGLAHLDRPFDYLVPAELAEQAQPGVRVRVRLAGRRTTGFLLARRDASEHEGRLSPLAGVVSPEQVLSDEVAGLASAVADRWGGTLADVLRAAVPPRHARAEARPSPEPVAAPPPPDAGPWSRYDGGQAYVDALSAGGSPRAVWSALPGPTWPGELAVAVAAALASGRGAVVVVPDARDLARVDAALLEVLGEGRHVALAADLGPEARYRRWLAVRRGAVRAVVGTRAAAFAPVADPGLLAVWDDGDDLHVEPHAPGWNVRDVLALRAHRTGAGLLVAGHARTVEGHALVARGFARSLVPDRATVRQVAPRVEVAGSDEALARDPHASTSRLPSAAFRAARESLDVGRPVLVSVPRRGYVPGLACGRCRAPARCSACSGPLGVGRRGADGTGAPACRWCGRPAPGWRCPSCESAALRAVVVGSTRTAEELGRAFPGVVVRPSGGDAAVLDGVPATAALVVATVGAEPPAEGGYGAVLLLDGWALLGRPDLRAGEEALRRWFAAAAMARPAPDGGRVVVVADPRAPAVQALVRWDAAGAAEREAAERIGLAFPPATRLAAVDGPAGAPAALLEHAALPDAAEVLGPVEVPDGWGEDADAASERLLVRVPFALGGELARALKEAQAVATARRDPLPARVRLDPVAVG